MGDKTKISWADATWSVARGCSRVSAGCQNCYAETMASRFCGEGQPYAGFAKRREVKTSATLTKRADGSITEKSKLVTVGRWTNHVALIRENLTIPLKWKKPRRIFVNSMADTFHERLTNDEIAAMFAIMAASPQHTFLVLTKRAKRMEEWFKWARDEAIEDGDELPDYGLMLGSLAGIELGDGSSGDESKQQYMMQDRINEAWGHGNCPWPLPNVHLGISAEDQEAADERIPHLLATPAAVRFLSCEPLLGPIRLDDIGKGWSALGRNFAASMTPPGERVGIDQVIAGCESGTDARPCETSWLRALRDQCVKSNVAFFLKQAVEHEEIRPRVYPSSQAYQPPVAKTVAFGEGSRRKAGNIIELPYLDGKQWKELPPKL